jgi:hypothetical protein
MIGTVLTRSSSKIFVICGLSIVLLTQAVRAQIGPSAEQFAKEGRYREASDVWYEQARSQQGIKAIEALDKALLYEPSLTIMESTLDLIRRTHTDLELRSTAEKYLAELFVSTGRLVQARELLERLLPIKKNDWSL